MKRVRNRHVLVSGVPHHAARACVQLATHGVRVAAGMRSRRHVCTLRNIRIHWSRARCLHNKGKALLVTWPPQRRTPDERGEWK